MLSMCYFTEVLLPRKGSLELRKKGCIVNDTIWESELGTQIQCCFFPQSTCSFHERSTSRLSCVHLQARSWTTAHLTCGLPATVLFNAYCPTCLSVAAICPLKREFGQYGPHCNVRDFKYQLSEGRDLCFVY